VTTVRVNPEGYDDIHFQSLNLCFPGWGDRNKYSWYFRRKTSYPDTDLIFLEKADRLAAGSGVSYRRIALPNGREAIVGIMTGSWTLPDFRGQGCFATIIQESLQLARQRDAALLLAFVTLENPSCRQLVKAGSAQFPSSYVFSTRGSPPHLPAAPLTSLGKHESVVAEITHRLRTMGRGYARFTYASSQEIAAQFIDRPCDTEILGDGHGGLGIVERGQQTDILQLCLTDNDDESDVRRCLAAFHNNAFLSQRSLFLFSTRDAVTRVATEIGLNAKPGCVTALIADQDRLRDALGIQETAPLEDSPSLARPGSPWFLGSWHVQTGDRT